MLTAMWDSFNPINWYIGVPAVVWIIAKDRGWRKGYREARRNEGR